jgi:hypothetical protein
MPAAISRHIPWQCLCTGTTYSHPFLGRTILDPCGAADHRIGQNKKRGRILSSASLRNLFQAFSIENVAMPAQGWMRRWRSVNKLNRRRNNIL